MWRLNGLLEQAIAILQTTQDTGADPYRGLHIEREDVVRLLTHEPGAPLFASRSEAAAREDSQMDIPPGSRLDWLQEKFELSKFDLDVVAIALAPELDLSYERIYAYLQDDVTRKRPSIDLALNLLSPNPAEKLEQQVHFSPDAALLRHGLLQLIPDPHQAQPPFLSYALKLDDQVSRFLLARSGLDPRLAACCDWIEPTTHFDQRFLTPEIQAGLRSLSRQWQTTQWRSPLKLYFQGKPGLGQQTAAVGLAVEVGSPLLWVNLAQFLESKTDFKQRLQCLSREVLFQKAVLCLDGLDALDRRDGKLTASHLLAALPNCLTILTGEQPWIPSGDSDIDVIPIPFTLPDFAQRRACWQTYLGTVGTAEIAIAPTDLDALADRFRLTPKQIEGAIATACNAARWQAACLGDGGMGRWGDGESTSTQHSTFNIQHSALSELFVAARAQSRHDLAAMTRKIQPRQTWNDLILPSVELNQLRELCNQVKYRHVVYDEWGFDQKLSLGKGLSALFSGSPGTGKTMAAEAIAHELQLDLYKIDLSQVVSKYIGETEKNLDRIFTAAENANAILLFDEADALFGKRSEVKDAHDRYANLEVAYLLQQMDEYEGISILTSNLRQNLDEAFTRRIRFIIEFPFPDEASRLQIWQGIWSNHTLLDTDVNLPLLAQQFKLAGGNIRNVSLAAAFLAAAENQKIHTKHLLKAIRHEFQKMGRLINETEFLPSENAP
ncbi:MAG: ATP-binding protein [Cyanobacteria bacterium CRU_2_1]|nr:ATP-binding protein [Cyanobacteria bacterium RU_5_0]NJR57863.1 ATP-binding protein [Cyanobacteria bacterium CRU_2_1]